MTKGKETKINPEAFLEKVGAGKTKLHFRKNQLIFSQGDPCEDLFFIEQGRVKITVISEQGKEAVVALMEKGQFMGEGCLNGQMFRIATAAAVEECVVTKITKMAMMDGLRKDVSFAERFMAYLLQRNSRIESDLIDQLFNSSEKRLARLLLILANFGKEGGPDPISVNVSQETLAEMIGTTRARVNYFMNKFRKLGFISYNGKIEVHQSLLNAVLHEQPRVK